MPKPKVLTCLLHAASALGALLGLGWLMREGLGATALLAVVFFLLVLATLLMRQYPMAVGDGADICLCWLATRARALAHYHQSGRLGYNAEVNDPMKPIERGVLEEAR
jgi:hypothetical protein